MTTQTRVRTVLRDLLLIPIFAVPCLLVLAGIVLLWGLTTPLRWRGGARFRCQPPAVSQY